MYTITQSVPTYIFPTVNQPDVQIVAMLFCTLLDSCKHLNQLSFGLRATEL